jgi:hypothetical protein
VTAKISITDEQGDAFVRFDEFEDVVLALELVAMLAKDVRERPQLWKRIVTGMQNAMQGAMAVTLAGTDGCGALRHKSQLRNCEWLNNITSERPVRVMADYPTLLARAQNAELMQGPPLAVSADELRTRERLNEVRREFAHFNPMGWSIGLNYLLNIMPVALTAVAFLLQERPLIHLSEGQKTRISDALATARNSFAAFPRD